MLGVSWSLRSPAVCGDSGGADRGSGYVGFSKLELMVGSRVGSQSGLKHRKPRKMSTGQVLLAMH